MFILAGRVSRTDTTGEENRFESYCQPDWLTVRGQLSVSLGEYRACWQKVFCGPEKKLGLVGGNWEVN